MKLKAQIIILFTLVIMITSVACNNNVEVPSNIITKNEVPSYDTSNNSPYTKKELEENVRAPSKNPEDYNKDGEFVPHDGPSNNPEDYNVDGEFKPIEEMTPEEIERELIKMLEDAGY